MAAPPARRVGALKRTRTKVEIAAAIEEICRDGVLALATVEIEIAGVAIILQGLKLRRDFEGRILVELPMFEHPNGARFPCVGLYDDLTRGVVDAIIDALRAMESDKGDEKISRQRETDSDGVASLR